MLSRESKIVTLIALAVGLSLMLVAGAGCSLGDGSEPNQEEVTLKLSFMKDGEVAEVERTATDVEDVTEAAITELLKGPQEDEEGYETAIPEGTELVNVQVEDGKATVELSADLDDDAKRQVEETVKANNEEVEEVEISTSSDDESTTSDQETEELPEEEDDESSE